MSRRSHISFICASGFIWNIYNFLYDTLKFLFFYYDYNNNFLLRVHPLKNASANESKKARLKLKSVKKIPSDQIITNFMIN